MYMAIISGWQEVAAFSNDKSKAQNLAVKKKKSLCPDELDKWTWENCEEYFGAYVEEIKDGTALEI